MRRILVSILIMITACSESTVEPDFERVGQDYFPLAVGQFSIYNVKTITYQKDVLNDTTIYQLKSEIVDSFESQSGDTRYVINQSTRFSEVESWAIQETWTGYLNGNQAVIIEGNIPYLKLSFPLEKEKEWDGNRLNTLEEDRYLMDSIGNNFVINQTEIVQNTITVVQSDNQDFISEQDQRFEVYASGIGLIYKQVLFYDYCTDPDCIGLQQIDNGILETKSLIRFGKN